MQRKVKTTIEKKELPANTREMPIGCAVTYAIGGGWGKEEPRPGTVPTRVIRGTDFKNIEAGLDEDVPRRYETRKSVDRRRLEPGDIILEISGGSPSSNQTTGRSLLITQSILEKLGEPVIPASFCRLVRFNTTIVDQRYAFYSLREMYASGRAALYEYRSTGISNFQFKYFLDKEKLRISPMSEQRAIAHILGTLDEKIGLNHRINETLEEMARALLKSWFVDFDPVRAKAALRTPAQGGSNWTVARARTYLDSMDENVVDLFPDRLVDSDLGEIPEGWEVISLGELFTASNVRLGDINVPEYSCTNSGLVLRSIRFKKKLSTSNSKNKVIRKGDFVFGLSRRILNFGLMRDAVGCVSPAYRTYSANEESVIPDLLERIMRFRSEYFYLAVSASSREGQSISQDALYRLKLSLPSIGIQKHLYGIVQELYQRSKHLSTESRALAEQLNTLLPKLVSGQVRIGDSERSTLGK